MEENISSRERKRIESDQRILAATVAVIGKKGYANSNIREIASEAGITPGLIMQRFETKENLLVQAIHYTNRVWKSVRIPKAMSAYTLLMHIIADAKRMYWENTDNFDFIYQVASSADIPESVRTLQREIFYERGMHEVLRTAQLQGNLPEGDLAVLYNIFICNALRLIRDYSRTGLKMPRDEGFLALIQYKDPIADEQQYLRNCAFDSVSQSYFSLIYFNIQKGTIRIARTIKEIEQYKTEEISAQAFVNVLCENLVDITCKESVLAFLDLSTVIERIGDKKVIAIDCVGKDGCAYRVSFIFVIKEPENEVVLCGIARI